MGRLDKPSFVWLLSLCACSDVSTQVDGGASRDASLDAAVAEDASVTTDAGDDAGAPYDPMVGDRVRATLSSGDVLEGELLHIYDRRIWWDPEEAETLALYDGTAFAPYPDDRSMAFVDRSSIEQIAPIPARTSYREQMRARGITLDGSPLDGEAFVITAHESYHLEENGYGDFAWDLVKTSTVGRFTADGTRNSDYLIWEAPVFLPTGGVVVEIEEGAPDHPPGQWPDGAVNNLIGVGLGGQYYLYLLHLRQGSVPDGIEVGTVLPAGSRVGLVGNSGASLEPHLHVTLLWFDPASGRSFSVPGEFRDILVRTGTVAEHHDFVDPPSGVFIASDR